MSLQVEKLEKSMAKLTIEVSAEKFEEALKASYKKNVGKINLPGFRKGKAPMAMIEKMYGAEIFYEDAANIIIPDAYDEEVIDAEKNDVRVVLHLHPFLAPFKAAVLPLSKKLSEKATEVYDELSKYFVVDFDEAGSIGKRYRRQDEIGTPLCITYDFDSEVDNCVTVRDRDTMEQVRIPICELKSFIEKKIEF